MHMCVLVNVCVFLCEFISCKRTGNAQEHTACLLQCLGRPFAVTIATSRRCSCLPEKWNKHSEPRATPCSLSLSLTLSLSYSFSHTDTNTGLVCAVTRKAYSQQRFNTQTHMHTHTHT